MKIFSKRPEKSLRNEWKRDRKEGKGTAEMVKNVLNKVRNGEVRGAVEALSDPEGRRGPAPWSQEVKDELKRLHQ